MRMLLQSLSTRSVFINIVALVSVPLMMIPNGTSALPTTTAPPAPPAPIVKTSTFAVQGTVIAINQSASPFPTSIKNADVFYGVPFGQAPIGKLRLEKPLPIQPYNNTLDCSAYTNNLPCYNQHILPGVPYTEDCLKLNIMRPQGTQASAKLPVLVYIYPGGYVAGAALIEAPPLNAGFPNFYVSQGILVVQIQYRLAVLGFGADGTSQMPGNLGLFDQQLALQWIHQNIAAFGGDPSHVTLFGTSAGSSSTSYHSVQRNSTGYFQRAIQMSGSFNSPWAEPSNISIPSTLAVAQAVGCNDTTRLKECLKNVSIESIQNATNAISYAQDDFCFDHWAPSFDGDFVSENFATMVAKASPKPTMAGFNSDESIVWTMAFPNSAFNIVSNWTVPGVAPSDFHNFTLSDLANFINANIVPSDPSNSQAKAQIAGVRQALIQFYTRIDNQANANNPAFGFMQYTRMFSDIQFIIPTLWEARLKSQHGWPVHLFHNDYIDASLAAQLPYRAVQHTAEYAFDIGTNYFGQFTFDSSDYAVQRTLLASLLSFIKTGQPTSSWPALNFQGNQCSNASTGYQAMVIDVNPYPEYGYSSEIGKRLAFWDTLSRQYDLGLVKSFPNTQGQCVPTTGC